MANSSFDPASLLPVIDGIPGPWSIQATLLFLTFVMHLVLMNAVVGVSVISLVSRLRSTNSRSQDHAPAPKAKSHNLEMLLPKGVALLVNFGIPPFLFLQVLYGQYIYSSSILMGVWWLSVMMLVMLAYYGLYINMSKLELSRRSRTLALGFSTLLLLGTGFIFVNNMTLMLSPAQWTAYARNAGGTLLALADPQVIPRYLHVVLSCLAVGGLCFAAPAAVRLRWMERAKASSLGAPDQLEEDNCRETLRKGLAWFLYPTLGQFLVGGWFLMALPGKQHTLFMGGSGAGTTLFFLALFLGGFALLCAWRKRALTTTACAAGVIICMAGMRTVLRSSMLAPYYKPDMGPFKAGPFFLFLLSLIVSLTAMLWLVKVYFRQKETPPPALATSPAQLETQRDRLMINEIAYSRQDEDNSPQHKGGQSAGQNASDIQDGSGAGGKQA